MNKTENQSTEDGPAETLAVASGSPLWLIAAERVRQQNEEGWTPEHDDAHSDSELARAAATYAMPAWLRDLHVRPICSDADFTLRAKIWPWEAQWWKPKPDDRKREIIKACALLLAEYERLSRAEALANHVLGSSAPHESS